MAPDALIALAKGGPCIKRAYRTPFEAAREALTMENAKDRVQVIGTLPRRDKHGNDITSRSLGSGGARGADGRLLNLVSNLKLLGGNELPTVRPTGHRRSRKLSPATRDMLIEIAIREIGVPLVRAAASLVTSWAIERLRPTMRSTSDPPIAADQAALNEGEPARAVDAACEEPGISMSSAEWQEVVQAWLKAGAVGEALRRLLAQARIENGDDSVLKLQNKIANLMPQQGADIASRMLESQSLDQQTLANLVSAFGEGRVVDSQCVPLRQREIEEEGPRSTDGGMYLVK